MDKLTTTTTTKITGIKLATGQFNNYIGHAEIMYNQESKKVWTEIFVSCNDFKVYDNNDIKTLITKGTNNMSTNWSTIKMADIKEAITRLNDIH